MMQPSLESFKMRVKYPISLTQSSVSYSEGTEGPAEHLIAFHNDNVVVLATIQFNVQVVTLSF